MKKIKIFVSYKNKTKLLKNDILTPIQTGRAISDEVFEEMIGDDTGANISAENPRYCELTAQYWVWKNYDKIGNPDYVGFMHNRRHFIFDPELEHLPYLWLPRTSFYFVDHIYHDYIKHFSQDKIRPYIEDKPDCIVYKKVDVTPIANQTNMKEHFYKAMPGQRKDVFETFEKIMMTDFEEYRETFIDFVNNHYMYCCNSFIMPKDLFFEYSEFLFSVLVKVDKAVNSSKFNSKEIRFLGFLGEYLLSIFLFQKLKNPNFKLTELEGTFVSKDYIKYAKRMNRYMIYSKITLGKVRKRYIKKYLNFRRRLKKV